jgi:hypothetical protein
MKSRRLDSTPEKPDPNPYNDGLYGKYLSLTYGCSGFIKSHR